MMTPEPAIVDLVHAWFDAASRGDTAIIDRHLSPNPFTRLVGSDPGEWLRGGDQIAEFLRTEIQGAAGAVTFTPSETEAFAVGDVGWAATKLKITLSDGKQINPRWTAVFVREVGHWRFVQTHASIAVPNDEVGWSYE
jgi:ketosteroid isomerase-like protein